ncbi:18S rRNA (adenine1779-N6/adenine1780-N6)-dimethyltransferase [Pancytospora philotis]|nr:18S rRNA (adenine1779-N6/adenine1780-N6)-dimethyltransferase [Pancytospora philotis]
MSDPKHKKSDEQHVLKNHGLVDTIIAKARVKHTDTVLEIAAGTGAITTKLLQKAKKVVTYESNEKFAKELRDKANRQSELKNKLALTVGDVLYHDFPRFDICISNIPFSISLPVVLKLVACDFKCAYILVQKEFGARLTAQPGSPDYSRLSVIVQLIAHVEHVMKVSRNSFAPPPKVDSCFMKLEPRLPRPPIDVAEFDNLLKICFGRKNKTLAANLKSSYLLDRIEAMPDFKGLAPAAIIDTVLSNVGLSEARTAKMAIEDFLMLLLEFKKANINFSS